MAKIKASYPYVFANVTPDQASVVSGQLALPFGWLDSNFSEVGSKFNRLVSSKVVSSNYTPTIDDSVIVVSGNTSSVTITLPIASTVVDAGETKHYYIVNNSAYDVTVVGTARGNVVLPANSKDTVIVWTEGSNWYDTTRVSSYVRAVMSANQSIAASTWTKIAFNTVASGGNFDTTNYRFIVPVSGLYVVMATINVYTPGEASTVSKKIKIVLNDGTANPVSINEVYDDNQGSYALNIWTHAILSLSVGDTIAIYGYSYTAKTVYAANSYFQVFRLR